MMTTLEMRHLVAQLKKKPVTYSFTFDKDLSPLSLVLHSDDGCFHVTLDLTEPHAQVSAKAYRFLAHLKDYR